MSRWKRIYRKLTVADRLFAASGLVYLLSSLFAPFGLLSLVALMLTIGFGFAVAVRLLRLGIRRAIWRLRNRLLVAYGFIALVPLVLLVALIGLATYTLANQAGVYLVTSELDRQMDTIEDLCETAGKLPRAELPEFLESAGHFFDQRFPGFEILVDSEAGRLRFPADTRLQSPPKGWHNEHGLVVRAGQIYGWAHVTDGGREITVLAPLTREFFRSLAPSLGDISLVNYQENATEQTRAALRRQRVKVGRATAPQPKSTVPPAMGGLDFDVVWGAPQPVAIWDAPNQHETALLALHSRLSAIANLVFTSQPGFENALLPWLYLFTVVFLIVEIASAWVGVSITRTITSAVHNLYDGTQRVMEGSFSHRIEVKGKDQLAELSTSFNRMTENLERLVVVAKEKERLQSEIEIAREVQNQLFPKSIPKMRTLRMLANCTPARMVSGDYYDYQPLEEGVVALAMGDVAGKGISAALLMATLQSSLRTQLRNCLDISAKAGNGCSRPTVSTSTLVSQLNQQLYSFTSPEKYATFCFGVYEERTGTLTYTNAGHLPPILLRKGLSARLDINGTVVGAFEFAQYEESCLRLEAGDLLLFYTDGITEPENEYGEMFGEDRLIEVVQKNLDRGEDEIIRGVVSAVHQWTGSPELQDDMTLLLARRT